MFKSKAAISVMLAGVVCASLFMCVTECISGRDAWADWLYPSVIGIVGLVFVLVNMWRKGGNSGK